MISGFVQVWIADSREYQPPQEIGGTAIPQSNQDDNAVWFQGHIITSEKQQFSILGVPAYAPPPIHSCMISDHDTPSFYDLYIGEYNQQQQPVVKYRANNVEKNGGTGDALELRLLPAANNKSTNIRQQQQQNNGVVMMTGVKMSTTRLLTGERAVNHLSQYAPDVLKSFTANDNSMQPNVVVCLGVVSLEY